MALTFAELEVFYKDLVIRAHKRGLPCAITSGMACVAFGVAATTQDCDLLCAPDAASGLLTLIEETLLKGKPAHYRGHLGAPLDERWLKGGWTSHFVWGHGGDEAFLDVFGVPPRSSSPWQRERDGLFASRHTVAEMKRTRRDKDWPYSSAIGVQMLQAGDSRGWMHVFDAELLLTLARTSQPPPALLKRRPVLSLALKEDLRLRAALLAEIQLWHELDRLRLEIYQKAARAYTLAVKRARLSPNAALRDQHDLRIQCARAHLPENPLADFGLERWLTEARAQVEGRVHPDALRWLPDVREHLKLISE